MSSRVCCRLAPRSSFHLGERGVGMEETSLVMHSDTFFSALCLALRRLGVELDQQLESFPRYTSGRLTPGQPPFRISSLFPYSGGVYFFPRPLLRLRGLQETGDASLGKKLKKIKYVSKAVMERLLAGESFAEWLVKPDPDRPGRAMIIEDVLLQNGQAWISPQEKDMLKGQRDEHSGKLRLWVQGSSPHVTLDRVSNLPEVYATGRLSFAEGCGLFFLAEYLDPSWQRKLEQALSLLEDEGIGGERSSGYGHFKVEEMIEAFELTEPSDEKANAITTLSLYWPTEAEVRDGVLDRASYSLVNRRGWMASPQAMNLRRRSVRMLAEGSVVGMNAIGALVDVKPLDVKPNVSHPVWRYGLSFPLHCILSDRDDGKTPAETGAMEKPAKEEEHGC